MSLDKAKKTQADAIAESIRLGWLEDLKSNPTLQDKILTIAKHEQPEYMWKIRDGERSKNGEVWCPAFVEHAGEDYEGSFRPDINANDLQPLVVKYMKSHQLMIWFQDSSFCAAVRYHRLSSGPDYPTLAIEALYALICEDVTNEQ